MAKRPFQDTPWGDKLFGGRSMVVKPRFDMTDPMAQARLAKQAGELITKLRSQTLDTVRERIHEGFAAGKHPNAIALELVGRINPATGEREGGIIGLSSPQAKAAASFRDRLSSDDPSELRKALGMSLRDKRFDATIEKAIDNETRLDEEVVDRMSARYIDNALRLRAETISRTETGSAVMGASQESFRQGLAKSNYTERDVIRTWRTAGDNLVRDSHAEMDGAQVEGLNEPYTMPSGDLMMHPLDTSLGAGPEEVINCRCDEEITIDFSADLD